MTRIVFPIATAESRKGKVYGHFGKAKRFYIMDNIGDPSQDHILENTSDHFGGTLSPPDFVSEHADVFISIGMGQKAIDKFQAKEIPFYKMKGDTIEEV